LAGEDVELAMAKQRIPTPQKALEILSPITPEIYRALEYGGSKTREYFDKERVEYVGSAYAMLVRVHAKHYLKQRPEFATLVFDKYSMCGISFLFNNWKCRLWKSADHRAPKLPHPGHSTRKQLFYVQPEQLGFPWKKKKRSAPNLHLVILWNLDKKGNLETLWLVCPKYFNQETGEIKIHWCAEIPNPIFGVQAPPSAGPAPALPLERKRMDEAKEG